MKLCVAFDLASKDECLNLARELAGLDIWAKIGLRSYLRDGARLLDELRKVAEFKVFLDLKIYDIPNTMADACEECAKIGADMINLHASAGKKAMSEVMNRLNALKNRPLVLGVSALTSFDEASFSQIYGRSIDEAVLAFSQMACESGLDGVVCSAYESLAVKNATNSAFLTLTPGIRPFKESKDDQARVADLAVAKANKSDFIVVGRPIYKASNPRLVAEQILAQIKH